FLQLVKRDHVGDHMRHHSRPNRSILPNKYPGQNPPQERSEHTVKTARPVHQTKEQGLKKNGRCSAIVSPHYLKRRSFKKNTASPVRTRLLGDHPMGRSSLLGGSLGGHLLAFDGFIGG